MFLYVIALLAIASRFVPHLSNAAPITALAIMAAMYGSKKQAVTLPLAVRFISDLFLGFFAWPLMVAVYVSHLTGAVFGFWAKGSKSFASRFVKVLSASVFAPTLFFLVTNFAFLYSPSQYSHSWSGIMLSYTNGLPFFRGTLVGDVGYTMAFFLGFELVRYFIVVRRKKTAGAVFRF
jgi:hypothetical protein